MTVVSCARCAARGKTKVGYRNTAIEPIPLALVADGFAARFPNGPGPSVRVDVDLCPPCRSEAAKENAAALSRRQGRDKTPPGFLQ